MRFMGVVMMLLVAGTALCHNVQMSVDVARRVGLLQKLIATRQPQELIRLLPELKEYVNSGDQDGRTPLHWSVYVNDIESATELFDNGADPNLPDRYGRTAVHEAARVGSNEMLNLIVDNGGDTKMRDHRNNMDALFWAAFSGKKESLQTLMRIFDLHNEETDGAALYSAILQPDDPNQMDSYDKDKMAKLKLLLNAGVVPDISISMMIVPLEMMTPLADLFNAYADKMEFHTDYINVMNRETGTTLLRKAMEAGSVAAAELLLDHGAALNLNDVQGENELVASYRVPDQLEIAKLFIEHGVEVRDNIGGSVAFYSALIHDDVELAEMLLDSATSGKKDTVPDEWFIFDTPTLGTAPSIEIAQSQEMKELLRDYHLDRPSKTMVQAARQRTGQNSRKQGGQSDAAMPDFLENYNELAAQGKFKPVIGREREIQQVITALARKEKNNPILIGEPGVGKTAIVEGLAQRIVAGDVPETMRDKTVYTLDMGAFLAGNMIVGDLEAGIKDELLPFLEEHEGDAILFIDEVHQLISSGAARGMADQLKPPLARGDLCCIGATTQSEYQQHIMKDGALERRFLPVMVGEPSREDTIAIVSGLKSVYEQHHGIEIPESIVGRVVELAGQYITDRHDPDRSIDTIDMAAARLAVNGGSGSTLQFEDVAQVMADRTGVPVERMLLSKQDKVKTLLSSLQKNIFGQDRVLEQFVESIAPSLVGIGNSDSPPSVLLLGPTGVGKTETARVLAEHFFGSKDNLISINLSEYSQKHEMSSLLGAPAGYLGFDESGILTEAVRRKPYSVLLFDELGAAHPDFATVVLSNILDKGELTDKKGRTINFKNTIVIITGNTAASKMNTSLGFKSGTEKPPNPADLSEVSIPDKIQGRLEGVLLYDSLGPEVMGKLINKQLKRFNAKFAQKNISISLTSTLNNYLRENGYNPKLGARALQNLFVKTIDSPVAMKIAMGELKEGQHYRIGIKNDELTIKAKSGVKEKQ